MEETKKMYMTKEEAIAELCENAGDYRSAIMNVVDIETAGLDLFCKLYDFKMIFPLLRLAHLLDHIDTVQRLGIVTGFDPTKK